MFQLTIESVFSAAHALMFRGALEPLHGHDWHLTVTIEGPDLDADGVLWDFHDMQASLAAIIDPFKNRNLNEVAPFAAQGADGRWVLVVNPSAEAVARHVGEKFAHRLHTAVQSLMARYPNTSTDSASVSAWPSGIRLVSVRVTEAVGCAATWLANEVQR